MSLIAPVVACFWPHEPGNRSAVCSDCCGLPADISVHMEAPFGGYKQSGIGRELGMHALNLYIDVKNIFISLT